MKKKRNNKLKINGWGSSRGHEIICLSGTNIEDDWRFKDTLISVCTPRDCAKCGVIINHGEPDACLGMLPNVRYACCGHGIPGEGYVLFDTGERISIDEYFKRYPKI